MKKKIVFCLLILILSILSLLAACSEKTTPGSTMTTQTATVTATQTATVTKPAETVTTSVSTAQTPTSTAVTQVKWWDKFGKPVYGGDITVCATYHIQNFDVTRFDSAECQYWHETMFEPDWTVDRNDWSFSGDFTPDPYWRGALAESWELKDAQTAVVHLRHGIHWQDKAPVNGREFVADDIVQHYDRIKGTGSGYTEPNPMFAGMLSNWDRVTATDDYTVVFKFKTPVAGVAFQAIADMGAFNLIEAPESVKEQGGAITDWKKAVGTGPWMLTDYVVATSLSFAKNPNYGIKDPRYPENSIPYLDKVQLLIIPDVSTQIAALRTGKVDIVTDINWQKANSLLRTNPELQQASLQAATNVGLSFRLDHEPFTDINVRKALQMAIDINAIADGYYGGTAAGIPYGLVTPMYKGYCYAYEDWPQSLKDEYAYNPTRAKELLASAGYPDGFETNVVTSTNIDLQLLEGIKDYFLSIGVDMEIRAMDPVSRDAFVRGSKHDQLFNSPGGFTWPPTRVIEHFYSKGADQSQFCMVDAGYDAIRDKFWAAGSADEVAKVLVEADKYVIEQHWVIVPPLANNFNIWQSSLKGYSGERLGWGTKWIYAKLWRGK